MRRAFVLRISPECEVDVGKLEGWVEDVDSGRELKFKSVPELLSFVSKSLKNRSSSEDEEEHQSGSGSKA